MFEWLKSWRKPPTTSKKITTPEEDALIVEWLQRTADYAERNMQGVDPHRSEQELKIYNKNQDRFQATQILLQYLAI